MFDSCKFVKNVCPFSVNGEYCGQGKGESRIEDIVACDGKNPKYKVNKKYIRDRYGRKKELREEVYR